MKKRYSVVVPHYNDSERLVRLLRSIPVDREDVEIFVVDDCSPNQIELDAVRSKWPQVCWLSTVENAGAGVARNVGLDSATGQWLLFADSDDEFLPGAFNCFDRVLQASDELVFFLAEGVQEVDGSLSLSTERLNSLVLVCGVEPSNHNWLQLRLNHVVPWAKVYSRSFVKSAGVRFDHVRFGNDVAFNVLAAAKASNVSVVQIPVYRYYRRSGSLMTDLSKEVFLMRFSQAVSIAERLDQIGFNGARSATGYILRSFKYGPRVFFHVLQLAIRSPMKIEWIRLLQLDRWVRFLSGQRAEAKEYARLKDGSMSSNSKHDEPN